MASLRYTLCYVLSAFAIVACCLSSSVSCCDQPVVQTSTATFHGKSFEISSKQVPGFERTVDVYSQIPYAEPPVGNLRYARPVPKSIVGDFDATRDPVGCAQIEFPAMVLDFTFSEDCLFLDVAVPQPQPENAAVMVWIHGGGYHVGAPKGHANDTLFFAAMGDVIVVTINYRLGMLGFMTTGDDSMPANLGLLDQRQALLWVQENIASFGGDPSRVTIFGVSAGSGSVNLHLLSPMSAGLFSGAIMQSGALTSWTHQPVQTNIDMTKAFGKELGCDGATSVELVSCLRGKPVEELIELQQNATTNLARYTVFPVPDGEFLLKDPFLLAAEGSINPANVMVGCLSEEGNMAVVPMFGRDRVNKEAYGVYMANILQMRDPLIQDLATVVFGSDEMFSSLEPDYRDAAANFLGDSVFLCPTFDFTQLLAQAGKTVFSYLMTHRPSHSVWGKNMTGLGPTHGEDVAYVFGAPFMYDNDADDEDQDCYLVGRFNVEEVEVSIQMMKYWSNFGKTGDPNLSSTESAVESEFPVWPKYTTLNPKFKELNSQFENRAGNPFAKRCHFLKNILPNLLGNTAEIERLKSLLEGRVN
eukprot:XP_787009.3 PREDICTED: cholinesterase 1-like [Strongylocentrotus purpuratus]